MCTIIVQGKPRAQGSKVLQSSGGKTWIRESDSGLPGWRDEIRKQARKAMIQQGYDSMLDNGAGVSVQILFLFERPKSVSKNRAYPNVKPDIDKLCRAVLDALSGVCYSDDGKVVDLTARKAYALPGITEPGCVITVEPYS